MQVSLATSFSHTRALLLGLCAMLLAASCASAPVPAHTAQAMDLSRFMGRWYVVARVPNVIERGHMSSYDDYSLRDDGKIAVTYRYRTGPQEPFKDLAAVASVIPGSGNREWRMRFFRVVPTTQRVLEVAPDYSWALLDAPGRDLAWIFARAPSLTEAQYVELRERLRQHGVNVDKVWRVVHHRDEIGQRGFDQPKKL